MPDKVADLVPDAGPVAETDPEPRMELVYVTSPMALDMLSKQAPNRTLSRAQAAQLAEAFQNGDHRVTGDAIEFNTSGQMTNGQHRMLAVIMADLKNGDGSPKGLPFFFMYDAPDDEGLVRDTGRKRTFADHLRMQGVSNAGSIRGVGVLLYQYRNGTVASFTGWRDRRSPTNMEMDRFFRQGEVEQQIRDGIAHADAVSNVITLSRGPLAVAWIILSQVDHDAAENFFRQMAMAEDPSTAVLRLQRVILKQRKRRSMQGWYVSYDNRTQLALILKTWNFYRAGTAPEFLAFKSGGAAPESFPVPV